MEWSVLLANDAFETDEMECGNVQRREADGDGVVGGILKDYIQAADTFERCGGKLFFCHLG